MEEEVQESETFDGEQEDNDYLLSWEFHDHPQYVRGWLWYVLMILGGLGLLLYAIFSANFLFALIIIMFALVFYLSSLGEPARMRCAISEDGMVIGQTFYSYREFRRFWFIYEPPTVRCLYLEFKSSVRPRMKVDLEDINPNQVREILSNFIHEDMSEEDEPLSDFLGRILKI